VIFFEKYVMEQCICVTFNYKMGKASKELKSLLQVTYSDEACSCSTSFEWCKYFESAWEDCQHSGCVFRLLTDEKNQSSECVPFCIQSTFDNL